MGVVVPKTLQAGDTVGIVAPSDAVERYDVEAGVKILRDWGLKVKVGKHVYARVGDFAAGTAEERMEDLRTMLADSEVKCIWAAGGGYAATEILPVFGKETIEQLKKNPVWFVGYSDVCLMLNALTSFGIVNIMGPTLGGLSEWDKKSQNSLRNLLMDQQINSVGPEWHWKSVLPGIVEGRIVASNLELLILSFGSRFDPLMYGSGSVILCLEELDIDKSQLQRQMDIILNHKKAKRIAGVVIGRLTNISEVSYPEWGKKFTPEELVTARIKKFGAPLAYLPDFGHPEWIYGRFTEIKYFFANRRFLPLLNGAWAKLTLDEKECKLEYLQHLE